MAAESVLRIFSYLPNPRVWKALIAAEYCGVQVEVLGDKPPKLAGWLWDFDARELTADEQTGDNPHARISRRGFSGTLYKTDEFLEAHPFGTVPAAFDPTGRVGIFESNSILRAVARSGAGNVNLYGDDPYQSSRIDSFLDADLVFAREAQVYLLSLGEPEAEIYQRMSGAYEFYLNGLEQALTLSEFIAGPSLSIADIAFVCDLGQFMSERARGERLQVIDQQPISSNLANDYPKAYAHLRTMLEQPEFAKHAGALNKYLD